MVGERLFAVNPVFGDGTRLREAPCAEAEFNGVEAFNDWPVRAAAAARLAPPVFSLAADGCDARPIFPPLSPLAAAACAARCSLLQPRYPTSLLLTANCLFVDGTSPLLVTAHQVTLLALDHGTRFGLVRLHNSVHGAGASPQEGWIRLRNLTRAMRPSGLSSIPDPMGVNPLLAKPRLVRCAGERKSHVAELVVVGRQPASRQAPTGKNPRCSSGVFP